MLFYFNEIKIAIVLSLLMLEITQLFLKGNHKIFVITIHEYSNYYPSILLLDNPNLLLSNILFYILVFNCSRLEFNFKIAYLFIKLFILNIFKKELYYITIYKLYFYYNFVNIFR